MRNDTKEEGRVEYMSEFRKFQTSIMEDRNYNTVRKASSWISDRPIEGHETR